MTTLRTSLAIIAVTMTTASGCSESTGPSPPPIYTVIVAGSYFTCGLASDGVVSCWGDNAAGELGDGTTINRPSPVEVSG